MKGVVEYAGENGIMSTAMEVIGQALEEYFENDAKADTIIKIVAMAYDTYEANMRKLQEERNG